ncbi:MAG: hypothetical protein R3Y26_01225 [Rikenellaceae bacterium]
MRKNFKMAIAAMILGIAGYVGCSIYKSATMTEQEILIAKNIEALTNVETNTTWNCDASVKTKCSASCPSCGTKVSGTGALSGSHSCNQ